MSLKSNDYDTWLETVWDALHAYREDLIPEGDEVWSCHGLVPVSFEQCLL